MSFPIENVGREYLGNRLLFGLIISALAFLVVYFSLFTSLPTAWKTPGSFDQGRMSNDINTTVTQKTDKVERLF